MTNEISLTRRRNDATDGLQMPWKCLDCDAKFMGPASHTPEGGCVACGSQKIFDCNVEYAGVFKIRVAPLRRCVRQGEGF